MVAQLLCCLRLNLTNTEDHLWQLHKARSYQQSIESGDWRTAHSISPVVSYSDMNLITSPFLQ